MMTGRLVQCKGSLARAALPFVFHLKWGWHRVERAMERGKFSLDDLFDRADTGAWRICRSSRVTSWACTSAKWWRWIPRRLPAGERRRARRCWAKGIGTGPGGRCGPTSWRPPPGSCGSLGCGSAWSSGSALGPVAKRRWPRCFADLPPSAVPRLLAVERGLRPRSSRRHGPGRADGPIAH